MCVCVCVCACVYVCECECECMNHKTEECSLSIYSYKLGTGEKHERQMAGIPRTLVHTLYCCTSDHVHVYPPAMALCCTELYIHGYMY